MCGIVASATLCVGLAYGLLLRNFKAALTLAITTSLASALTMFLAIIIFDQFGIRVGGMVPFAMSKVTSVSLLLSAITGGMVLGVGFSRFVKTKNRLAELHNSPYALEIELAFVTRHLCRSCPRTARNARLRSVSRFGITA